MNVWKAFAVAYPKEGVEALKRNHHVIARPNMKLGDYVVPLISPSFRWVTFLSLSNIICMYISEQFLSFSYHVSDGKTYFGSRRVVLPSLILSDYSNFGRKKES